MQTAHIEWRKNQPYSIDYNDIYFSTEDGLKESHAVFIDKNNLVNRFKDLSEPLFTIIETGFGTGLNFLAIANCWCSYAPQHAALHYISIEKTPLNLADLTRAHALWPQLSTVSNALNEVYHQLNYGRNNFDVVASHINLELWIGDVNDALRSINQLADAWVLDGFAPAKNQDMWTAQIFEHMARLSSSTTTFATFTSAGDVRRGLQAVGFNCTKHAGYGKKREMLSGVFTNSVSIIDKCSINLKS